MNDDENFLAVLSESFDEKLSAESISYLYNKSREFSSFEQIKRIVSSNEQSSLVMNLMLFIKNMISNNINRIRIENILEIQSFLAQYTKRNFEFLANNRVILNHCLLVLSMCIRYLIEHDKLLLVKELLNDIKEFNTLLLFDLLRELFSNSFKNSRDMKELKVMFSSYLDEALRVVLGSRSVDVVSLITCYIKNLLSSFLSTE